MKLLFLSLSCLFFMSLSTCDSDKHDEKTPTQHTLSPAKDSTDKTLFDTPLVSQGDTVLPDSVVLEDDSPIVKPTGQNGKKEVREHGTPDPDKLKEIKEEKNKKK